MKGLVACGYMAAEDPGAMLKAEKESREQERLLGGSFYLGHIDLSQQGMISLPTSPAGISHLRLACARSRGRPRQPRLRRQLARPFVVR